MANLTRIVNTTSKTLRGRYNGAPIVLGPAGSANSWEDVSKEAAEYHRGNWGDQIQVVDTSNKVDSYVNHQAPPKTYWIANASGDPDAPEFYEEVFRDKVTGEDKLRKVRNDLRNPTMFEARLGRFNGFREPGTWKFRGDNGQERTNDKPVQVTLPGRVIKIPPYKRIEVSEMQYITLLQRDAERPENQRGQIISSRPPTDFEPDLADPYWTYPRMQLWLELVPATDSKASGAEVMGPTEEALKEQFAHLNEDEFNAVMSKAKFDLWVRCTQRAHNREFDLPSKADFQMAEARKVKATKKTEAK